jgi:hypothetical protein
VEEEELKGDEAVAEALDKKKAGLCTWLNARPVAR